MRHQLKRPLTLFLVLLVLCLSMTPACQHTSTSQQSPKTTAYKAIAAAFSAYDLGMTTLRMFQKNNVITEDQYNRIKSQYGWPFYTAIKAADTAVEAWVKLDNAEGYNKAFAALGVMATTQKDFTAFVASVQKGGK